MTVYVDQRWDGHRGITRYAREITSRLQTPWHPFTSGVGPTSPLDAVAPARIRLTKNDLLYSPGFSAGFSRCRQLITLHDLIHLSAHDGRARLNRAFYDRVIRPAIRRSGHVLTVSAASRDAIADWLRDPAVSIHVTGEGASAAFTAEGEVARLDRPYFLYVGNMRPHKNVGVFLAAMADIPDHRAVIVSSDLDEAEGEVARAGIAERTTVLAGIDDERLAALYRGAAALVFPSLEEGFGLPPLEAIRSGCPVIYYQGCAAVAEVCGAGPGMVGSATDVEEWRVAMLAASPPSASQIGATGRYDWGKAARLVDGVLEDLSRA